MTEKLDKECTDITLAFMNMLLSIDEKLSPLIVFHLMNKLMVRLGWEIASIELEEDKPRIKSAFIIERENK